MLLLRRKHGAYYRRISNVPGTLAADSAQQISNSRPGLKNQVEGRFDQLKQPGEDYDLKAKKQVDQVWNEIDKVLTRGISVESIDKIKAVQRFGDQAWKDGTEHSRQYLHNSP